MSSNRVECEAEQARQAVKQAEKAKEKMSKSLESIQLLLKTQRTVHAEHKRMSAEFHKVEKDRDKAQEEVSKLTERVVSAEQQVAELTPRVRNAENAEQKLRELEKELFVNSKKHKWILVASALGLDGSQTKRVEYLAKHMHDTKSEDWKDSLSNKSDLTTRLPAAVCMLLQALFSCVRVRKKTVPVIDILRHAYKIRDKSQEADTELTEIQKAVRSAVRIVVGCVFGSGVCTLTHSHTH